MTGVFTAQQKGVTVGMLDTLGATGGVSNLAALARDPHQPCRTSAGALTPFTPATCTPAASPVMTLFNAWATLPNRNRDADRLAIARGEALFNGGLQINGMPGATSCSSCHALNNQGNNPSTTSPLSFVRLGLDSPDFLSRLAADDSRLVNFVSRASQLPVYTVIGGSCPTLNDPISSSVVTGSNIRSTDPGRALATGKCADLGAFKPPVLRDLAVRAPYFHNAAAASLDEVVNFYDVRFHIGMSTQQHSDLVAFLKSL